MDEVRFEIPGQPVPQPRPRISTRGGFGRAYTPTGHPIHAYRQAIVLMAQSTGWKAKAGKYELEVDCIFERPASHWTKAGVKASAPANPRGDWDNLGKGVSDAITDSGAIWCDDDHVVDGRCRKRYAERGESARTIVRVRRLG